MFDAALADYTRLTGKDLSEHWFASQINHAKSSEEILDILQRQSKDFEEYRGGKQRLISSLGPTVRVLEALSPTLEVASLVSGTYHLVSLLT